MSQYEKKNFSVVMEFLSGDSQKSSSGRYTEFNTGSGRKLILPGIKIFSQNIRELSATAPVVRGTDKVTRIGGY